MSNKHILCRREFCNIYGHSIGAITLGSMFLFFNARSFFNQTSHSVIDLEISSLIYGKSLLTFLQNKPILMRNRTDLEIKSAQETDTALLKDPQNDSMRAGCNRKDPLIVIGMCHLGHTAHEVSTHYSNYLYGCRCSKYDMSGRVIEGSAKFNLAIPKHIVTGNTIKIGCHESNKQSYTS